MTFAIQTERKKEFSIQIFLVGSVAFMLCSLIHPIAAWADYAVVGENNEYEIYNEEPDSQERVKNAQATLASLFGKNATMAVPPQIAGGTIALPSFDSSNLQIEETASIEGERPKTESSN